MKHLHTSKIDKRNGFTLLELLVVVFIISIMSGIILASINSGRIEKQVGESVRNLTGFLHELQQYSLTGKQFVANTDPCLYRVAWNSGSSNYTATYYYKDSGGACTQTSTIATYTLPNGVTFSTTGVIGFTLPYGRLNPSATSIAMPVTKGGIAGASCVYDSGLIKDVLLSPSCP